MFLLTALPRTLLAIAASGAIALSVVFASPATPVRAGGCGDGPWSDHWYGPEIHYWHSNWSAGNSWYTRWWISGPGGAYFQDVWCGCMNPSQPCTYSSPATVES